MARAKKSVDEPTAVEIPPMDIAWITMRVTSVRPIIVNAWDQKAQIAMISKQMHIPVPKGARDPISEYEGSRYKIPQELGGGDGIPAAGMKQSIVDACRYAGSSFKMAHVVGAFHVRGIEVELPPLNIKLKDGETISIGGKTMELLKLYGDPPKMRADMVRLEGGGTADMRFRAQYTNWHCFLPIQFNKRVISAEQLTMLVETAGFSCGVCEWRPFSKKSKNGSYGMFKIARTPDEVALFDGLEPPNLGMFM